MSEQQQVILASGSQVFTDKESFIFAVDHVMTKAIQSTKQRMINFLRSSGPNRGFLFPKDTGALIENGVSKVTNESFGGTEFQLTYGFDIFYASFVNRMNFVTKLGLYHYQFFERKLPIVKRILQEELESAFTISGFEVTVNI